VEFPEIDRVEWFDLDTAKRKIKAKQDGLIEELAGILKKK
jgi:predicted NUDIX family NTP pyrophosphohydrolase